MIFIEKFEEFKTTIWGLVRGYNLLVFPFLNNANYGMKRSYDIEISGIVHLNRRLMLDIMFWIVWPKDPLNLVHSGDKIFLGALEGANSIFLVIYP